MFKPREQAMEAGEVGPVLTFDFFLSLSVLELLHVLTVLGDLRPAMSLELAELLVGLSMLSGLLAAWRSFLTRFLLDPCGERQGNMSDVINT